jgi:four helix bundle protein
MITKEFDIKKRTFNFAIASIRFCYSLQESEKEYILSKQLIRSSTSVGANIRESRHAQSTKDFIHKLSIAQKECDETCYWLEIIEEIFNDHKDSISPLLNESRELLKVLSAMILSSKKSQN